MIEEKKSPEAQTPKQTGIPKPDAAQLDIQKPETPKPEIPKPDFSKPVEPEIPKSSSTSLTSSTSLKSNVASEETLDLQRKLIEKEKAVVDLEEKLATLKQRRAEDKSKLKEFEKMKMQNQQVSYICREVGFGKW